MTNFKLILTITITTLLALACDNSVNTYNLSLEKLWNTKDSLKFYFPQSNNPDSGFLKTRSDSFSEKWYSSNLYSFKEPILYNKSLDAIIYRFLWLRSFHRPVVLIFTKFENQITLTTKILNHEPEFLEHKIDPRGWSGLKNELKGKTIEKFGDSLIVVKADRKADIVYDSIKKLTLKNWNVFQELLQKANFWTMLPNKDDDGMDGSEWVLEELNKNKYRFVSRWSPSDEFQKAGIYLIKLSGLKERIY